MSAVAYDRSSYGIREVVDLHRWMQRWVRGEIDANRAAKARLATRFASGFQQVTPHGARRGHAETVEAILVAHGQRPAPFIIMIERPQLVWRSIDAELVTYNERQSGWEVPSVRAVTALLRRPEGKRPRPQWVFVHETWGEE